MLPPLFDAPCPPVGVMAMFNRPGIKLAICGFGVGSLEGADERSKDVVEVASMEV